MTSCSPSQQAAATELLRRRRARASLVGFVNAVEIPGKPASDNPDEWLFKPIETTLAAHHRLLLEAAQSTMLTPYGRLMVFMPPGSAKSTYGSVVCPTWFMGRKPGAKIILASYASDLARRHGRRARQIARSPAYSSIFSTHISADTSAADEWALTNGSEYLAGGLLSGITGNRAHGIVIDDPIKGRQQADSAAIRKQTLDAYEDDLKTRMIPGAWQILIQTRWSEGDLAGILLPRDYDGRSGPVLCTDGNVWNVLCLPAQCERADDPLGRQVGEYLWPEWFDERHWAQFRGNPRTWSALYQQRPSPDEGAYIKKDWLRTVPTLPPKESLRIYGASDYAVTQDGGDWTVHVVIGVDSDDRLYLLDLWRAQTDSAQWVESFCDLVAKWQPSEWAEETGQIKASVGPFLERRMRERQTFAYRRQFPTRGDKAVRAQSIRARMSMQGLYIEEGAPWRADFESELLRFPAGVHDDQVDALGLIGQMLDHINAPSKAELIRGPQDRYARRRRERESNVSGWAA